MSDGVMTPPSYDLVVIGCGPAGERAAIQAARAGHSVVVVERARVVGGTRVNWGTIPSKTLRESALFIDSLTRNRLDGVHVEVAEQIPISDFMFRERNVVQRELELINATLDRHRITVLCGHGRLLDAHRVEVRTDDGSSTVVSGQSILIATGSRPARPADVPFDGELVFDSDSILSLPRMPSSIVVLGAGVIGVEYAAIFAALGLRVTLLDTRERLLPYLDREIAGALEKGLVRRGVALTHAERYETIERRPGSGAGVRCVTRSGKALEADVLLYCVGRTGNTTGIGLESVGLGGNSYGLLEVNEHYQTAVPHIYAAGDVIGFPALASTSMEQGRRAARHAFNLAAPAPGTDRFPFAIYAIPEVSYVGESEEQLRERGASYVVGRGRYEQNPRGQILGDTHGLLKLLCDASDGRVLGAHIVGHSASELIHIGQAYLTSGATCAQIAGSLFNYPTLADLYRHAALEACGALSRACGGPRT
jgi:NAD(P) transhydrogenase